jgi:hypothetical protein
MMDCLVLVSDSSDGKPGQGRMCRKNDRRSGIKTSLYLLFSHKKIIQYSNTRLCVRGGCDSFGVGGGEEENDFAARGK